MAAVGSYYTSMYVVAIHLLAAVNNLILLILLFYCYIGLLNHNLVAK